MRQIMEQYGAAILAIGVALSMMYIFGQIRIENRQGLPAILGSFVENEVATLPIDVKTGKNFKVCMATPVIEFETKNPYVTAGQKVKANDYIIARMDANDTIPVTVERILTESYQESDVWISSDKKSFRVTLPGIYWVYVYAVGENGKANKGLAKIIVKEISG